MKGIGNTPLIKLEKLVDADSADIYVKFEGANPTGSMKDRMALASLTFEPILSLAAKAFTLKKGKPFNYFHTSNYETYSNEKGWL